MNQDPQSLNEVQTPPAGSLLRQLFSFFRCFRWLASPHLYTGVIFFSLVSLSALNMGRWNYLFIILMGLSVSGYLFFQGWAVKEILFRSHIRDDSTVQRFRAGFILVLVIALAAGFGLSLSLLVFLLTVHGFVLLMVLAAQLLFVPVHAKVMRWVQPHLKYHTRVVVCNYLTVLVLGGLTLATLILAKLVQMHWFIDDLVLISSDNMASYVMDRVTYDIVWVQHLARTMDMFELQLLRAYEFADGWFALLMLIYFLLPSTMAAFTLPLVYGGIRMFMGKFFSGSAGNSRVIEPGKQR